MRNRASAFVLNGDYILLFHRFKNGHEYYAVPGGGVEPGETPEQAAVRELKEETSLDVTLGEKIGELEMDNNYQYFYTTTSWSGTPTLGGEDLEKQSPNNVYQLEWVPLEKLGTIELREKVEVMLLDYLKK